MGRIFRAVHIVTQVEVAVKFIIGDAQHRSQELFHREVEAQAKLVHPGIVYLFDYGMAEDPYVVMELAQGTLRERFPLRSWNEVHRVLTQILDSLGYAHARGVIHRDLKPENLLVFEESDVVRLKLADFGIAHAFSQERLRDEDSLTSFSGTPRYMAPEQIQGVWRSYGPWTDLYSVGCIAYELLCGRPPFVAASTVALAMAHCKGPRPALEPQFDLPDGVEEWIQKALSIELNSRFVHAVEALRELPLLFETESLSTLELVAAGQVPTLQWVTLATTQTLQSQTLPTSSRLGQPKTSGFREKRRRPIRYEQFPDWRTPTRSLPVPLIGTGLGLFGLREVPMVDRETERDILWQSLREAVEDDALRVVIVQGSSGTGKSRLAQWLTTRVDELGLAWTFQAFNSLNASGPTIGFAGLILRAFRAWKMPREKFLDYLLARAPEADARALTELIYPTQDVASSPRDRYELLIRTLAGELGARRPLIWIDDLQWSPEGLGLIEYLLENPSRAPAGLVVATLKTDDLSSNPVLGERISGLSWHDSCRVITLDPLHSADHRALIDQLLPLERSLGDLLATRTEGTPLFAEQILNDWISKGALVTSEAGFRVADGASLGIPDDIHTLWESRVSTLLNSVASPNLVCLAIERAAILGREVDLAVWTAACLDLEEVDLPQLVRSLLEHGLTRRIENGFRFVHGLLVESIEEQVRQHGRWEVHHRLCADVLDRGSPEERFKHSARRAEHHIQAGQLELALEPLRSEALRLKSLGEFERCLNVLSRRQDVLGELGHDDVSTERLTNDLDTADIKSIFGRPPELSDALEGIFARAELNAEPSILIRALAALAENLRRMGNLTRAHTLLSEGLSLMRDTPDQVEAQLLKTLGWTLYNQGQLEDASKVLHQAVHLFDAHGRVHDALWCKAHIAWVRLAQKQEEEAKAIFNEVLIRATEGGYAPLITYILSGLGDLARFSGDLEEASRIYAKTEALGQTLQALNMAYVNQAQVALKLRDIERARKLLLPVSEHVKSKPTAIGLFECVLLALHAGSMDWLAFDGIFKKCEEGWPEGSSVSKDHTWILQVAAELASEAGEDQRADKLMALVDKLQARLA